MESLIVAIIWFFFFTINLLSDIMGNRLNYGIASATVTFIFFREFLEKSGYIGG